MIEYMQYYYRRVCYMKDREIDLKTLFTRIIYGWRAIAVWAVLGALVFTVFVYKRDMRQYNEDITKAPTVVSLSDSEKAQVQLVASYYRQIDNYNELKNRPLMQLDFNNVKTLSLKYTIDMLEEEPNVLYSINDTVKFNDKASIIAQAYVARINSDECQLQIMDLLGIEETSLTYVIEMSDRWNDGNMLYVNVRIPEGIDEAEVESFITEMIENISISEQYSGTYELNLVYNIVNVRKNQTYIDQYNSYDVEISKLYTNIDTATKDFSSEQNRYLSALRSGTEYVPSEPIQETYIKPVVRKKNLIPGFFIGIGIGVILNILVTILSSHIISAEEFRHRYDMDVLGKVWSERGIKKLLPCIDHFFCNLFDGKHYNKGQRLEQTAGFISLKCKLVEAKTVALTGTKIAKVDAFSKEKLVELLKDKGIKATIVDSILDDYNSLNTCTEMDAVVVVEHINKSSYFDISRELTKLESYKLEVLGATIVGC
ncbi:MAG: hypothetical protein ACI4D8_00945 [Wujia sp.]